MSGAARIALALLAAALAPLVGAGGPLYLHESGRAYVWPDGGRDIPYHLDQGALGTLEADEAAAQTDLAFSRWADVATASVRFRKAGRLPVDVTDANFHPYLFGNTPDGVNPVIYDEFGQIFQQLFGYDSGILGFASPDWFDETNGEIHEALVLLNGFYLLVGFPEEEMLSTQVHELGHFLNLAHSATNWQIAVFGDETGPSPFDTFPRQPLGGLIETMAPLILVNGGQATLHRDDEAILSALYPEPGAASARGTIAGTIVAPNARSPLGGTNVIARNIADPFADAVSALSGDLAVDDESDPLRGRYVLHGLTPGATYAVYADLILAGGYSRPTLFPLPGPEEFWNGGAESADPARDDPSSWTGVTVAGGTTRDGIDIVFNRHGSGPLPLRDDNAVQLWLPFDFPFCGRPRESLFVNANGLVSFGSPVFGTIESPAGFLDGAAKIAGLWDDLTPISGGAVTVDEQPTAVTVRWTGVPEYPNSGSNSFAITLHRASGLVDLEYGNLSAGDGLAGYSCGRSATTRLERPLDFAATRGNGAILNGRDTVALWEWYPNGGNDLAGRTITFTAPNEFRDPSEPNDEVAAGTRIGLPFDSREIFSTITPRGDIDFYLFEVPQERRLVLLETLAGNPLDTVLGLFDARTGELLAVDDDGGTGLLSRVVMQVPAAGLYAAAVSTYPDRDFVGAGRSEGRYVLSVEIVDGTMITLGDDDTYQYFFDGFAFPFQGQDWTRFFINSNGNITFGQASLDLSETVPEFLTGPTRIAAMWDDLNPSVRGRVLIKTVRGESSTVTFRDVPEYPDLGSNDFAVTMHRSGAVTIRYGRTNNGDAIVGVTRGRASANPGETDLSRASGLTAAGTTYELFDLGELDLTDAVLLFGAP